MAQLTLSIVIPCLNEKETIAKSIRDAKRNAQKYFPNNFEIIVADNGSTDGTLSILKKFKSIKIISVPVKGYGAALHNGILKGRGKFVCFADADLSYPFSNLKNFKPLLEQDPDLLLGSRLKGNIQKDAMPPLHRYLGTPVLTFLIRLIYAIPTTDCNSGMRVVKKSFYKTLNMRNSGMEWASELLLKTAIKNGKYLETPIKFVKDKRKSSPHLSTWADGWRHLKAIFLLKPTSLYLFMFTSLLAAYFSYSFSFALTSLFILLFAVLFFSFLALQFLAFAIEKIPNSISKILNTNYLVPTSFVSCLFTGFLIILLPDSRLGTKMILVGIISIIIMWVFLIETIKTHVVNRLKD